MNVLEIIFLKFTERRKCFWDVEELTFFISPKWRIVASLGYSSNFLCKIVYISKFIDKWNTKNMISENSGKKIALKISQDFQNH